MSNFDIFVFSYNRDQDMLPYVLKNIIRNVLDYQKITVVWDDYVRERPVDFDEIRSAVGYNFDVIMQSTMYPWSDVIGQRGWIKQQLAKLLTYQYSTCDYTWICDSDVLVTGDPELFKNGVPCLRYKEREPTAKLFTAANPGYYGFIQRYFKITDFFPYTMVGSTCLFKNSIIKEMHQVCERLNSKSIIDCVQETVETSTDGFCFSEFETYGNYCYTHHRDEFCITTQNWNYIQQGRVNWAWPVHVMWNHLTKDLDEAERICYQRYKESQ